MSACLSFSSYLTKFSKHLALSVAPGTDVGQIDALVDALRPHLPKLDQHCATFGLCGKCLKVDAQTSSSLDSTRTLACPAITYLNLSTAGHALAIRMTAC